MISSMYQGTRTGVPLTYVYPWYVLCSRRIVGDEKDHKYPLHRAILQGFPRWVRWDQGTSNFPLKVS